MNISEVRVRKIVIKDDQCDDSSKYKLAKMKLEEEEQEKEKEEMNEKEQVKVQLVSTKTFLRQIILGLIIIILLINIIKTNAQQTYSRPNFVLGQSHRAPTSIRSPISSVSHLLRAQVPTTRAEQMLVSRPPSIRPPVNYHHKIRNLSSALIIPHLQSYNQQQHQFNYGPSLKLQASPIVRSARPMTRQQRQMDADRRNSNGPSSNQHQQQQQQGSIRDSATTNTNDNNEYNNDNGKILVCYYTTRQAIQNLPKEAREYLIPSESLAKTISTGHTQTIYNPLSSTFRSSSSQQQYQSQPVPFSSNSVHFENFVVANGRTGPSLGSPISGSHSSLNMDLTQQDSSISKNSRFDQGSKLSSLKAASSGIGDKIRLVTLGSSSSPILDDTFSHQLFGSNPMESNGMQRNQLIFSSNGNNNKTLYNNNKQSPAYSLIGDFGDNSMTTATTTTLTGSVGNNVKDYNGNLIITNGRNNGDSSSIQFHQKNPTMTVRSSTSSILGNHLTNGNNRNNLIISSESNIKNNNHKHNQNQNQDNNAFRFERSDSSPSSFLLLPSILPRVQSHSLQQAQQSQLILAPSNLDRAFILATPSDINNNNFNDTSNSNSNDKSHANEPKSQQTLQSHTTSHGVMLTNSPSSSSSLLQQQHQMIPLVTTTSAQATTTLTTSEPSSHGSESSALFYHQRPSNNNNRVVQQQLQNHESFPAYQLLDPNEQTNKQSDIHLASQLFPSSLVDPSSSSLSSSHQLSASSNNNNNDNNRLVQSTSAPIRSTQTQPNQPHMVILGGPTTTTTTTIDGQQHSTTNQKGFQITDARSNPQSSSLSNGSQQQTKVNSQITSNLGVAHAPVNQPVSSSTSSSSLLSPTSSSSSSSSSSSPSQSQSPSLSSVLVSSPLSTMFDVFGAASQYLMRFKPSSFMSQPPNSLVQLSGGLSPSNVVINSPNESVQSLHSSKSHNTPDNININNNTNSNGSSNNSNGGLTTSSSSANSILGALAQIPLSFSSNLIANSGSSNQKGGHNSSNGILSRFVSAASGAGNGQTQRAVRREDVCGRTIQTPERRIIGGEGAKYGEFPYQVHIKIAKHQCGGALIDKQSIVTAAHCVYHFITRAPVSKLQIVIGAYDIEDEQYQELPPQYFKVNKVKLHPNFRFSASHPDRYDIAILKLDKPVKYTDNVLPVCLPSKDIKFENMVGTVTGFGKTDPSLSNRYGTRLLQKVDVPIIENNECERWHRTRGIDLKIFPEMMCAGYEDGLKDACVGDSGGPLVVKTPVGQNGAFRWTLAGITSAGFGCAQSRQPGIYHRVSHTVDWILDNLD